MDSNTHRKSINNRLKFRIPGKLLKIDSKHKINSKTNRKTNSKMSKNINSENLIFDKFQKNNNFKTEKTLRPTISRKLPSSAFKPTSLKLFILLSSIAFKTTFSALEKPIIDLTTSSNFVRIGSRAVIICRVFDDSDKLPTFKWSFKNRQGQIAKIRHAKKQVKHNYNQKNLHVAALWIGFDSGTRKRDFGNYTCIAENEKSEVNTRQSIPFQLSQIENLSKSPIWTELPERSSSARPGHLVTIHCKTNSKTGNQAKVIWFYNRLPVDFDGPDAVNRYKYSNRGGLTIKSIRKQDDGHYTCMAKNENASLVPDHDTRLYVRVLNTPPIWRLKPPQNITIMPGDDVDVQCGASGWPKPKITWMTTSTGNLKTPENIQNDESSNPNAGLQQIGHMMDLSHVVYKTYSEKSVFNSVNVTCYVSNPNKPDILATTQVIVLPVPRKVVNVKIFGTAQHELAVRWDKVTNADYYAVRYRELKTVPYNLYREQFTCGNGQVSNLETRSFSNTQTKPAFAKFDQSKFEPSVIESMSLLYEPVSQNFTYVGDKTNDFASNMANITGLKPYKFYQIQIQAKNNVGDSKWNDFRTPCFVRTLSAKPTSSPIHLQGVYKPRENSIYLSWKKSLNANGQVKAYYIKYGNLTKPPSSIDDYDDTYDNLVYKAQPIKVGALTAFDFKPVKGQFYMFKIAIANDIGMSDYSDAVAVIADQRYGNQLNMRTHVGIQTTSNSIIFNRIDGFSDGLSLAHAPEYTKFMIKVRDKRDDDGGNDSDMDNDQWFTDISKSYFLAGDTLNEHVLPAKANMTYIVTMQTRAENGFFGPTSVMSTVRTKPLRKYKSVIFLFLCVFDVF